MFALVSSHGNTFAWNDPHWPWLFVGAFLGLFVGLLLSRRSG